MMSILAIGVGWAATSSLVFTAACGGSGTADDGTTWTVTSDGTESSFDSSRGIHYGTSSAQVQYIKLTTSGISGTITKVVVNASTASGVTATASVTVGGNAFGGDPQSLSTTATDYTFNGSASGEIVVTVTKPNKAAKALYVKSVVVTYSTGGTSIATPTITLGPDSGPYHQGDQVTATIACETSGATLSYSYDGSTWNSYTAPLIITETKTIYAKATLGEAEATNQKTVTFIPTLTSLAEVNALADNAEFDYGAQTVVMGTYGTDNKNMYIVMPDNSAGTLVYDANNAWSSDYTFGKVINSGWSGTKTTYSTKPEVKNPTDFSLSGGTAEVTPLEITSSDLTKANFGRYAVFKDVTVTSDGTISGITTYNQFGVTFSGSAGVYDVYGVIGYHNNAAQFMPLEYVASSAPVYYLVGTFNMNGNQWVKEDANYMFTENNGVYELNGVDLPDETEFKIIKVQNGTTTWFGGSGGGSHYGIHSGHHNNISLVIDNDNFYIQPGAITNFSFTVNNGNPSVLNVNRDAQLFVKGDFSSWNKVAMTGSSTDGWTLTQDMSAGDNFGFIDEWGQWRGCGNNQNDITIDENNLNTDLALWTDGKNFIMASAGNYSLQVTGDKATLVVTSTAGDTYALVSSVTDLDETSDFIIVSKDFGYAMSTEQRTANRGSTEITLNNNGATALASTDTQVFKLEKDENGGWYFNTGSGYIYASSSSSNELKTQANKTDNAKASVTITDGVTSIVFQGDHTRNDIRFNNGNNPKIFSCYASTSTMAHVSLYKKTSSVTPSNKVATPVINPGSGDSSSPYTIYGGKQQITITCATEGATVYYTTDGSDPATSTTRVTYGTAPFDLESTGGPKTVKAIAVKTDSDLEDSEIATAYYLFKSPVAPTFTPTATNQTGEFTVIINTDYEDGVIYYMLDPEIVPTATNLKDDGTPYQEGGFAVSGEGKHTVYAIVELNGIKSDVASKTYKISSGGTTGDGKYVKVTSTADLEDGDYLIVYEDEDSPVAFNGALTGSTLNSSGNYIDDVVINNNTIQSNSEVDAAIFIYSSATGTFLSASGYYIGRTTTSNGMEYSEETAFTHTVSIDENGNAVIQGSGGPYLRYNTSFGFRYYGSGQQPIALYKKSTPVVVEPVTLDGVAFTADRQWATWYGDADFALPEGVTAYVVTGVQGDAVVVESVGYIPANTGVLLYSETLAESVSAMPYSGEAGTIPTNLLVGSLEEQTVSDAYLLYDNQFILAQNGTTVGAHRCYLPITSASQGAPVLRIGTPGTVTGVEDLIIDGNNDVMYYDLSGRCIGKSLNGKRGIFITSDGKKVVK